MFPLEKVWHHLKDAHIHLKKLQSPDIWIQLVKISIYVSFSYQPSPPFPHFLLFLPHCSYSKALFTRVASLLAKRDFSHLVRWIPPLPSSPWSSDEQKGASIPHGREYPTAITHHFTLLLLHRSVSASCDSSSDIFPSPTSSTGALNLFCSCRSAGGGEGAFLLLPELTSFQSDIQVESLFHTPVSKDSACAPVQETCLKAS